MKPTHVDILGAGIAGLTTAIALRKAGITYTIYEAAEKIGPVGAGLGLGANAIKAFRELGIEEEVMNAGKILSAFHVKDHKGKIITSADSLKISAKYGTDNFTIHRHALHEILLKHAGKENVVCNKRARSFERNGDKIILNFTDNSSVTSEYLIVADGLHSPIRKQLLPDSKERYAGYTCWRGVTETNDFHITEATEIWGAQGRFGIVPIADNKIYWFLCVNAKRNDPAMRATRIKDLYSKFHHYPSPVPELIKSTKDSSLIWADICDLKPIHQYAFDNILLIGDAGHATTPNMGQGACQAIEDAVYVGKFMEKYNNVLSAFKEFEKLRMKRTHFIVNRSWQIGKMAQWQNPVAIRFRNLLMRSLPESFSEKQLQFLYNVDFNV